MAFEFEQGESVAVAVRRIAVEEADRALGLLVDVVDGAATGAEVAGAIHEARKCCKRLRGLIRLVRPSLGERYAVSNAAARDASRHLSQVRDAHALVGAFDELTTSRLDEDDTGASDPIRATLVTRADRATEHVVGDRTAVEEATWLLTGLRRDVGRWPLDGDLLDELAAGAAKTAARATRRFLDVVDPKTVVDDELLHQWRKRVKYCWYHASLVEPAAPSLLGVHADQLRELSDLLGDDHDLAVLAEALRAEPEAFGGDEEVRGTLAMVGARRSTLQRRAVPLGARLHAEAASAWGRRLAGLLTSWWTHGPERPAERLADALASPTALGGRTTGQLRALARDNGLSSALTLPRPDLLAALRAAAVHGH